MATTFSWRVKSVKSDPNDDDYIKEVVVEVYGTEGSVTMMETQSCLFTGDKASVGSDFKAYSTLIGSDKAFTDTGEDTIVYQRDPNLYLFCFIKRRRRRRGGR